MNLYQDQKAYLDNIRERLRTDSRLVCQSPTGSGKTVMFTAIAEMAKQRGWAVVIITESKKIRSQIARQGMDSYDIASGVGMVSQIKLGCIYIAMAQTLSRRQNLIEQMAQLGKKLLVIIDEAHISTACAIVPKLDKAIILAFTATPIGEHLSTQFPRQVCHGLQPKELIQLGRLSELHSYERRVINSKSLQKRGGEFTEESQILALGTTSIMQNLCDDLREFEYKKCIIFTASIEHCDSISKHLHNHGFNNVAIHSESTDNIAHFEKGDVNICVSVGMLTKGYDFPIMDLGILFRATTSLPLYLQMCGRVTRVWDGKSHGTLIDYGGNIRRHGLWEEDRNWDLKEPKKKGQKKENEPIPNIISCDSCLRMYVPPRDICECGASLIKEKKLSKKETELKRITSSRPISTMDAEELATWAKEGGRKSMAIGYAKTMGWEFYKQFTKAMGYHHAYADKTFYLRRKL